MLPSYDEAVSSGLDSLAPGYYSSSTGQGHVLQTEDQNPPAYPGTADTHTLPSEFETCDSISGSSELLQSLCSSSVCQMGVHPVSDRTDVINSATREAASSSPSIDIADGKFYFDMIVGCVLKAVVQKYTSHMLCFKARPHSQPCFLCLFTFTSFILF